MNYVFLLICLIWFGSEIIINRFLKSSTKDKQGLDKNSLRIIWITIFLAVTASITISSYFYIQISSSNWIYYVGLTLILLGCILRLSVIRSLGKQFTVDVTIRQGHQLKTDGIYKYLRHPSYSASLLSFIGLGLTLNNWASLFIITIAIAIAFRFRIKVEEQALITQFGEEYINYRKKTFGLIPLLV